MKGFNRIMDELNASRARSATQDRQFEIQQAARVAERNARQRQIDEFLCDCQAVPAPIEAYALWLAAWISQGGRITHSRNYDYGNGRDWMMPTRTTDLTIPTAYGAQALRLIVLAEYASVPMESTSGDRRNGWEWGHGRVLNLTSRLTGMRATTNDYYVVESYPDVEDCIRSFEPRTLSQRVRTSVEFRRDALAPSSSPIIER